MRSLARKHTLKVGHKGGSSRVQGVNDHLAIDRSSNLDTTIGQTWSGDRTSPRDILTDCSCLRQKVGEDTLIDLLLTENTLLKKSLAGVVEGAVQGSNELKGLRGEDLSILGRDLGEDGDTGNLGVEWHGARC